MLASERQLLSTRYRFLPLLLVTPFALLAVAGALDLLFLVTGNSFWTTLSFTVIPAGVVGCIAALAICLHDWFAVPAGSRVRAVGVWFAIGTGLVGAIFAQSWAARFGIASDAGVVGVILGFMGAAIALLTGWLLGEYLDRLAALQPLPTTSSALVEHATGPQRIEELIEQRQVAHA